MTVQSLAGVRNARTLSGLDPATIKVLSERSIHEFLLEFQVLLLDSLEDNLPDRSRSADVFVRKMSKCRSLGSLLADHKAQRADIAAFGLVLIDRFVKKAEAGADGWDCILDWAAIEECMGYVYNDHLVSSQSREAAGARHHENRELRNQAIQHYIAHEASYKSMDAAATAIAGKIVPVTFRTVRNWISEHRKDMRSARKP